VVGDHTGNAELALWETFIDTCELSKSYKFTQLKVKVYHDKCSLYTPKENANKINKIADLQDVVEGQCNSIKCTNKVEQAKVIAVSNFGTFYKCISCREGYVVPVGDDESFGRRTECSTALHLDTCQKQISALLTIKSDTAEHDLELLGLKN
jgi:hypothetical protein